MPFRHVRPPPRPYHRWPLPRRPTVSTGSWLTGCETAGFAVARSSVIACAEADRPNDASAAARIATPSIVVLSVVFMVNVLEHGHGVQARRPSSEAPQATV